MQTLFQRFSKIDQTHYDAYLISSVPNITYLTGYAGFSHIEREAYLLIAKTKQYLFTDGRYTEAVLKIRGITLVEISSQNSFFDVLQIVISKHNIKRIGFEADDLRVSEFVKLKKLNTSFVPSSTRELRMIKTEKEITNIKKACAIGDKAFLHMLGNVKRGISEKQLAFLLESYIRENGAELSFPTIVAFGKNAAIPHHHTSNQRLKTNDFVLLDFGVRYKNYCSDMTRTVFFGKPTPEQKRVYDTVLEAQKKAVDLLNHKLFAIRHKQKANKTRINAAEIDQTARNHIIDAGYPSIPHSLGHGIGIAVHEAPTLSPKSKDVMDNGMLFSIEPGIYLPKVGGVRIEDLYLIQDSRLIRLTHANHSMKIL